MNRPGWALWIGGRPGSGKTTLASRVRARLGARGVEATVLPVPEVASLLAPRTVPSRLHRVIVARAVVAAAKRLVDAGLAVIIDGTATVPEAGEIARQSIADFMYVELACPVGICRARERAVRWSRESCPWPPVVAAAPDLALDYEAAVHPDLVLYTDVLDPDTAATEVLHLVDRLERAARDRSMPYEFVS